MKKIFVAALLSLAVMAPSLASAQVSSAANIQAQIQALLTQIQNLQNALQAARGVPAPFCHSFNADLQFGNRSAAGAAASGDEVGALQKALQKEGFSIDAAETANGSAFGESTSAAVVQFQAKYGIRQSGYVGPLTRTKLNALYNCASGATVKASASAAAIAPSASLRLTSPASGASLSAGTSAVISWTPFSGAFDRYQLVVGNSQSGAERQLYDRVSPIDYLPASQTSFKWNVPDLLADFSGGTGYSYDQLRNNFYLQVKAVKSDAAGGGYVATSTRLAFSAPSASSANPPSIYLGASDAGQYDAGGYLTVRAGDSVEVSGIPQNLSGLSYGSGTSGYTMSWNFDSSLSSACVNGQTSSSGRWTLSCVPSVPGTASIYAIIYRNGVPYRSNTITLSILPSASAVNSMRVISPNGGEYFIKGQNMTIQWNGGSYPVEVGVVNANFPSDSTVVGWIQARASASGSITWDASHIGPIDSPIGTQSPTILPGQYKILVVSPTSPGYYCWGQDSRTGCAFDASDAAFTIGN